jgi:beta-lactamase superfamily II metal-dependent hydrolase
VRYECNGLVYTVEGNCGNEVRLAAYDKNDPFIVGYASPDYEKDEDNNASLIAAVEAGGVRMLFTGDALKPRVQEFLAEQYDGSDYQLLKVPHHGRETKPTALLLENFSPRYALISSSEEEPENEKLLKRLEKAGVEPLLLREGAVQLRCQDAAIERVSE